MKLDLPSDSKGFSEKILGNSDSIFVLLTIYFAFVIIRFAVSLLFQYPLVGQDESMYKSMALSYFATGSFFNTSELGISANYLNFLYPLLITPSFWFGENFHIAIKLINSLLMNAAIFPLYLLCREFLNKKDSLIICTVVLTLPFFNFINVVMVEASYLPLFLTCFYLAFKSISLMSRKYALLTCVFLVISFFSKVTAVLSGMAIVISFFVCMILGIRRPVSIRLRSVVVSTAVIFCGGLISYLLLKHFSPLPHFLSGEKLARVKYFLSFQSITFVPLGELIHMTFGLISTFLLTYLIPFYVMILTLIGARRNQSCKGMDKNSIFAVMLCCFFFVYLVGVVKYHIDIYPIEHFYMLHGRYFSVVSPLLVVGFAASLPLLKWRFRDRITLLIAGAIVMLVGIAFFLPKFVSQGQVFVGNPDLAWYSYPNEFLRIPMAITFVLTILYYVISVRPSRNVFLGGIVFYGLICNFGIIRAAIPWDAYVVGRAKPYVDFIGWQLPKDSKVVVIESKSWYYYFLAFEKSFYYVGNCALPAGTKITRQSFPKDADYLILFDEYDLDFPVESSVTRGKCKIIALHNSVQAFKEEFRYKFGDTIKFSEGGNYNRYIEAGWCDPDPGFIWSDGSVSRLRIRLASSPDSDLVLRVNCIPLLAPPKLTHQRVKVIAGDEKRCDWTVIKAGEYECVIPASAIKDSVLDLAFEFPDAASPKDYNLNLDSRKLGLAFQSLTITEADQIPAKREHQ